SNLDLWASSVFYASDGFDLIFFSSPSCRHARNLAQSLWAAATVNEDYHGWREIQGIQMEGPVYKLSPGQIGAALRVYLAKFPWVRDFMPPLADRLLGLVGRVPPLGGLLMRRLTDGEGALSMVIDGRPVRACFYRLSPVHLYMIDNRTGFAQRQELVLKPDALPAGEGPRTEKALAYGEPAEPRAGRGPNRPTDGQRTNG
ncbi:MAG TPA: hypothetical protein VJ256_05075, partial [Dehalococcoidia bacterium]|nr:hypothetical protein [Dehalococcoidia bacterium]